MDKCESYEKAVDFIKNKVLEQGWGGLSAVARQVQTHPAQLQKLIKDKDIHAKTMFLWLERLGFYIQPPRF